MTDTRYTITVTRWAQETGTNENGPYLTGRDYISDETVTLVEGREALRRELDAHGVSGQQGRMNEAGAVTSTRYRLEWAPVSDIDDCPLPEVDDEGGQLPLHRAPRIDRAIPELISVTEFADMHDMTRQGVLKMINDGRLPAARAGKTWVIRREVAEGITVDGDVMGVPDAPREWCVEVTGPHVEGGTMRTGRLTYAEAEAERDRVATNRHARTVEIVRA